MGQSELLKQVIEIAKEAGEITKKYFKTDLNVETKSDSSPVTLADQETNDFIVERLKSIRSDWMIVAEESIDREVSETFWLVDPLDGTKEFLRGSEEYTVNIGLVRKGVPVLGVVVCPVKEWTFFAEEGLGAFKQEGEAEPVKIFASNKSPKDPLIVVESKSHRTAEKTDSFLSQFTIQERIQMGSSLKICLVADGTADLYPRFGPTMEWDTAAADCIYRYASKTKPNKSPLIYGKQSLKNPDFIIGVYQDH